MTKLSLSLGLLTIICSAGAWAQNPPLEAPYTQAPSSSSKTSAPIEKPAEVDEDTGDFYYHPVENTDTIHYKVDSLPPIKGAAFVRFGTIGPFDIKSDSGNLNYKDVYSKKASVVAAFEYQRHLGHFGGKWSYKLATGVTTESGSGRFNDPSATLTPREKYQFIVFPNTALLNYKLNFSDRQYFTPYLEAGGGYFTFIEYRNDGDRTAFGGAPVLTAGGGLLISLDLFEKNASSKLYEDYGINGMWLDLSFRQNVGLDDKKDFTSSMATGGFGFAF